MSSVLGMLDKQIDARLGDGMPPPDVLYVDREWLPQLMQEMHQAQVFVGDPRDSTKDKMERGVATYRGVPIRLDTSNTVTGND